MTAQSLLDQLLVLPDVTAQKRLLRENNPLLSDEFANVLKEAADEFLRSDLQRSLEMAELLLYLAELTENPLHRAIGLIAKGNAYALGGVGKYERAIELYDESAEIYRTCDQPVGEARAQIGKVFSLASLGRYDEALEIGEWASRVFEEHGEWLLLVKLTSNLGTIHYRLGDDTKTLALDNRARDLCHRLGTEASHKHLARIEQNRSITLRNLGRFEASIQASQTAYEMMMRSDQRAGAARARQSLAITYLILGRYNEALELLDQARDFFLADGRRRDAILAELFISDCLLQYRRFSDVLDKSSEIREQFTELGTRLEVAQAVLNEAVAYAGLGRYAEALASLEEARRIFEAEGNTVLVASTEMERAIVLHDQNKFRESRETAQTCADVFDDHDLPIEEARALLVAGRAAAALNQHQQAHELVTRALTVSQDKDVASLMYQCHHLQGTLAQNRGDPEEALKKYDQAIQKLEQLRGRLMVEFRADYMADKQGIYEDAVDLCLSLDQPRHGLEYAERAKSRALLDMLAYRLDLNIHARNEEDRAVVDELTALRSKRDRLYRRLEGAEEFRVRGRTSANGGRQQAQQDVLALEKRITDLWHQLLVRNADYARDAALWHVRTEPVQPFLNPQTLLLEYFTIQGKLVIFLVTADNIEAKRLDVDLGEVQRLLQLLWLNLRAVPRSNPSRLPNLVTNARGLLQQLYELLVAPIANALSEYSQLIIVPHGPLHYLPFHALHDGQSFLVARHEITYLPGASFLRYVTETESAAASDSFALGHPYGGALPHAVQEAQSVATILGGEAALNDEATLARFREALPHSRVLHMAAHGDFRPDNPLFSGLALADGWLTTLDIFNLRLKASLVTLSACQTGRNVVGGGDELLGLMRAFLYAGAASLLLTLWAVEDRSAAQLMELFYQKLAEGWGKGAALRHAQLQFIHAESTNSNTTPEIYSHPYFWAPFFLVGDAGPL